MCDERGFKMFYNIENVTIKGCIECNCNEIPYDCNALIFTVGNIIKAIILTRLKLF